MSGALLVFASYLVGAFPTSYVAGRLARGIDLREHGSGNLGSTNAFRVLGWRGGLPVFAVDLLKGFAPVALFVLWDGAAAPAWALAYGAAAILGHVFPVYTGFRGGKGVATGAGVFLGLAPWALGGALLVWAALAVLTRIVSVASLAAAVVLPVLVWLTHGTGPVLWFALGAAVFVVYAHRSNLRRLLRGEEKRFGNPRVEEAR